ncbi:MAG TPA: hypothetical protein VLF60_03900 [Candidatus Saccharimonadales bacterium]|nr:hypothetical protein [Candidatus Saccharimonadales bacterium]
MRRRLLTILGMGIAITLFGATGAHALNAHGGSSVTVAKDQVIDSTLYAAGKTVTVSGTVKGDVFCAGQNVDITGTVDGDVICAGQQVRVSGKVHGNIRLAGQTVTITGTVDGSASVVGQTVSFEDTAHVGKDLTAGGQTVRLGGVVGRDVVSTANATTMSADVARNVDLFGSTATLTDTAKVGGDLAYTSDNEAQIVPGATIHGHTEHKIPVHKESHRSSWSRQLPGSLYWVAVMVVMGLLALWVTPRWFKGTITSMQDKPLSSIGFGVLALIATPIVAVLIAVTIVGIPFGVALFVLWLFAVLSSLTFAAYAVGDSVVARLHWLEKGRDLAALVLGILLLAILLHIPFVGFWVGLLGTIWGLGGVSIAVAHAIGAQHDKDTKKHA